MGALPPSPRTNNRRPKALLELDLPEKLALFRVNEHVRRDKQSAAESLLKGFGLAETELFTKVECP